MRYVVLKWHFLTDVRFGSSKGQLAESGYIMHSDTLFSALCLEAKKQGGDAALDKFYQLCHNKQLLLSDTMPYRDETYFLPKPILKTETKQQESSSVQKKAYKKLKYISAEQMTSYLRALSGQAEFDAEQANKRFGECVYDQARVMVSVKGQAEPRPYYVNTWHFADDAGLYLIAGYENEQDVVWLEELIKGLGLSGVGGKKNSGLGKFEVDAMIFLDKTSNSAGLSALRSFLLAKGQWLMTISCALPREDELDVALKGAAYQVLKRSGFVDSPQYAKEQRKHKNLYVLAAGSCFAVPFDGDIYDVSNGGAHPVYRYAQPLFLGVDI